MFETILREPPSPLFLPLYQSERPFRRLADSLHEQIRFLFLRRSIEAELIEPFKYIKNSNFMTNEEIDFKKYPLNINWKKIEENKESYLIVFSQYGLIGTVIYDVLKLERLRVYNILIEKAIDVIESFATDSCSIKEKNDTLQNLPDFDIVFSLIKNKVILFREIPVYIIFLKFYEVKIYDEDVNCVNPENKSLLTKIIESYYLLLSRLKDYEYNHIYKQSFLTSENAIKRLVKIKGRKYLRKNVEIKKYDSN